MAGSNDNFTQAIETVVAASAPKVMYGGGAAGGLGFYLSNEVLGLMGLLIALAGFLVNLRYKHKEHALKLADERRKQEEHQARMALYE